MKKVDKFLILYVSVIISLGAYLVYIFPRMVLKTFLFLAWGTLTFFVLTISTCYYMRYFLGRQANKHPLRCTFSDAKPCAYEGENVIHRYHRYFFWGTVVFASLLLFTGVYWNLFHWETFWPLLIFSTLWVLTCHHFKYFVGKVVPSFTIYKAVKKLNRFHGYFVWGTLAFLVLHLVSVYYYLSREVLWVLTLATLLGIAYLGSRRIKNCSHC